MSKTQISLYFSRTMHINQNMVFNFLVEVEAIECCEFNVSIKKNDTYILKYFSLK